MSQILTQSEVDALLTAVSDGELDALEESVETFSSSPSQIVDTSDYQTYDLTSKDRIFRGKMPMMDLINDKFSRAMRTTLNLNLRKVIDIEVDNTRLIKYGEFLNSLPLPTCINIFTMNPLRGNGLFILESRFIYILIDLFCGGAGVSKYRVEGREFTAIELRLVQRIVLESLRDLQNAWESIYPLDIDLIRTEINPQFVSIAPPDDIVVLFTFNVDVEDANGKVQIVLPYSSLEPIREKLQGGYIRNIEDSDNLWQENMKLHVAAAPVEISTIYGHTDLTIEKLLNLRKGDVLQLNEYANEDVEVLVKERAKFQGQIGVSRGYRAVQLTRSLGDNNE